MVSKFSGVSAGCVVGSFNCCGSGTGCSISIFGFGRGGALCFPGVLWNRFFSSGGGGG